MFKPGQIIVCVNKKAYDYSQYYNRKYNVRFKKSLTWPKTITIGKSYEVISTADNLVFIKNDRGILRSFREDRFLDKIYARRIKINEIYKKIKPSVINIIIWILENIK